ncbi:carbohydrate-binding protein [Deinococcus maricopensis]|uniref:Glucan endo-1,6-beta-glucosidase n=1 Tax=Deinococcus maricopensis (strain DSM 21211 / LMG 22137 / NRRL B-23946 / LB-34) TaxID=709986 RepID=E8U461_DEIML|nr:carbohydrate-binding protein [Deinococcus maricopensis]ADV65898.1 Glucan endo-1,6-beta-glucosidase [Deinococcus maricopensis DSM 21211]
MVTRTSRRAAAPLTLALLLAACTPAPPPTAPTAPTTPAASAVHVLMTTGDAHKRLSAEPDLAFARDGGELFPTITVDAGRTYQRMEGVGAALTESSAWLIQHKLSAAGRDALLHDLFDAQRGAGFDYVRLPMGASDFARSHYTYDDVPAGSSDATLAHFSVDHDRADVLPVAVAARTINPNLQFMASPWSAPAWMKTSGSLIGGQLKPEAYSVYAQYFRKFVDAYRDAGVPISAVTVQNEPHHEPGDYPGMRMEPDAQAAFIGAHLAPALKGSGTKILAWDHNWDEWDYPLKVLADKAAYAAVDGTGFHCYGGDVSAQSQVHDTYPGKDVYFTECSGGAWADNYADNLRWNTRTLLIGATRNWAKTVLLWNLALDETHGPHTGGCGDCRGVVTINGADGTVQHNVEYDVLGQYGKAVRPGAVRIDSSTYNTDAGALQSVAFRNPDGRKALIVLNDTDAPTTFKVKEAGASFYATLPAASVATYTWTGAGSDAPAPDAPAVDASARIEAEAYSRAQGVQTEATTDEGGGRNVGHTDDGDYLVFDRVKFGAPATGVQLRVASGSSGGTVEFRTGSVTGPVVATANVPGTGGWQAWTTLTVPASVPAGTHALYVVFPKSQGINLNWLQFTK